MEGPVPQDYHDWYTYRPAVVYLRLCEGLLPSTTSTTARDAGEFEEEARCYRIMTV